jgi:uncharacterized membrane protein YjjP (DUF1212 family)
MTVTHPQETASESNNSVAGEPARPVLDRPALADVVDLALWAGQLLMQNGAESRRVAETVTIIGTGLGCDWGNVLVSYNAIIVTHISGDEFRTKIRRVSPAGVNMSLIEEISHLTHRVEEGRLDRFQVRLELDRISTAPRSYNRWVVVGMVGLACAAFSRFFGGDWVAFGITFLAASAAMFVRQELTRQSINNLLVVLASAFVAGGLVGLINLLWPGQHLEAALAASVLLLIPGVPFINTVEDLIKEHLAVGMARGMFSILTVLAIALGLMLAMWLTAVSL